MRLPNGAPYENTKDCENILTNAARDARFLGLMRSSDLVDRRSEEPILNLEGPATPGAIWPSLGGSTVTEAPQFARPVLYLTQPHVPQRFHVEIWIEKTTMDRIIVPLAQHYGVNLVRGAGELSHTRCVELVDRAVESGQPSHFIRQ